MNLSEFFLNRNQYIFTHENVFENIVWKTAAILSRSRCVSGYLWLHVSKRPTILLQYCDWTLSCDDSTSSGDGTTILTASNTVKMIRDKMHFI